MPRPSRLVIALALTVGLLLPGAPPTAAAPLKALVVKTVRINDKPVRFVLAVDGQKAFVLMKFRRDGKWRTVASDRTDCRYLRGSHDPSLQVQKADKQILVAWTGPDDTVAAEYGGYGVRRKSIEMFGAESCPAAG